MKNLLLLLPIILALLPSNVYATDTFKVTIGKTIVASGNTDQQAVYVNLNKITIRKRDCLTINYSSESNNPGWQRTFLVTDSADNNVSSLELVEQSGTTCVNAWFLKEMMLKKRPVFIYTTSLPTDPSKAAVVRVRRILLCKIEWN